MSVISIIFNILLIIYGLMGFEYSLKIGPKKKFFFWSKCANFHGVGEGVEGEMVSCTGGDLA